METSRRYEVDMVYLRRLMDDIPREVVASPNTSTTSSDYTWKVDYDTITRKIYVRNYQHIKEKKTLKDFL